LQSINKERSANALRRRIHRRGREEELCRALTLIGHGRQTASFLRAAIALQNQPIEFLRLLGDAVRDPLFILAAGCRRRLLDKLPKVVAQDRNAIVEFRGR
jgi:hypothetical protein